LLLPHLASKATAPDSLTGGSIPISQIFWCIFPHSGLCEAVSVHFSLKMVVILETGCFFIICTLTQAMHSQGVFSNLLPPSSQPCQWLWSAVTVASNRSPITCTLEGVSCSTTCPQVHLVRFASRSGWVKRKVFTWITTFCPGFIKIFQSFLPWDLKSASLHSWNASNKFLGKQLSHPSVSAGTTTVAKHNTCPLRGAACHTNAGQSPTDLSLTVEKKVSLI
jgi:hypothetical protein